MRHSADFADFVGRGGRARCSGVEQRLGHQGPERHRHQVLGSGHIARLSSRGAGLALRQIDGLSQDNGNVPASCHPNLRRLARLRRLLKGNRRRRRRGIYHRSQRRDVTGDKRPGAVRCPSASGTNLIVRVSGVCARAARRLTYPFADAIVMQTQEIALWARQRFKVPVHVLPNPVRLDALNERARRGHYRSARDRRGRTSRAAKRLRHSYRRLCKDRPTT